MSYSCRIRNVNLIMKWTGYGLDWAISDLDKGYTFAIDKEKVNFLLTYYDILLY